MVPKTTHNILWIPSENALPIWCSTPFAFATHHRKADREEKLCLRRLSIPSARRELPRPRPTLLPVRQLWFCWRLLPSMLFGVPPIWQFALGSNRFHRSSWRGSATLLLVCSSTRSFAVRRESSPPPQIGGQPLSQALCCSGLHVLEVRNASILGALPCWCSRRWPGHVVHSTRSTAGCPVRRYWAWRCKALPVA